MVAYVLEVDNKVYRVVIKATVKLLRFYSMSILFYELYFTNCVITDSI